MQVQCADLYLAQSAQHKDLFVGPIAHIGVPLTNVAVWEKLLSNFQLKVCFIFLLCEDKDYIEFTHECIQHA
jgi:hypothetical protein